MSARAVPADAATTRPIRRGGAHAPAGRPRDRPSRRPTRGGLTDRGRALIAAGITLTASGMALGFLDLTRVGLLVIGLPLLMWFAYQVTRPRLEVQRHVEPLTLTVGQKAMVSLAVHNRSAYPSLSMPAEDSLTPELGGRARFLLPAIPRRGTRSVVYTVRAERRGLHRIGPLAIRTGDPFGLTNSLLPLPGHTDLVALPAIRPLVRRAGLVGGSGSGGADTLAPGQSGMDDASLRQYHVGDDLRRIHWPVTAHRGELIVRHDGRAPVRQAVMCLDPELPHGRGEESPALEWAVEALASIASHLVAQGYSLRLALPAHVAAGQHAQTLDLDETVRKLALVNPQDGRLLERARAASWQDAQGGATESRLVTATRDIAVGSGLVVLAVGAHDAAAASALLGTLPAGTAGIALILDPDGFAAYAPHQSGHSERVRHERHGPGERAAHELVAFAASGGWRARVVRGPEPVEKVWNDVAGGSW